MAKLNVEGEIYYKQKIYIITREGDVYIPANLYSLIDPVMHSDDSNFRRVVDSDLELKILEVYCSKTRREV